MGMRQTILIIAVVALVGCAMEDTHPDPTAASKAVVKKPEPSKTESKPEAKKTETLKIIPNSPEAAAAIEAEIRKRGQKPEGKLTKADLGKVQFLDLGSHQITDLDPLVECTGLEVLDRRNNKITDVSFLAGLNKLVRLTLIDNQITDVNVLAGLKQLELIDLRGNPGLTKAEAEKLQKALQKCEIRHNVKE